MKQELRIGDTVPIDGRDGLTDGHTPPTWYALTTPPQKERAAREYLRAQGVYAFFPDEERKSRVRGKVRSRKVPLVSGYVFARFEGNPRWHVLRERPFFNGVVSLGGIPYPMPRPTIRRLMGLTVEDAERRRELRELREAARRALEPREGERARITDGPLAGFLVDVSRISGGFASYLLPGGIKGSSSVNSLERIRAEE